MITTVCLNPSFDKTALVDEIRAGDVNRLSDIRIDMGGKGFNVAVVAKRLGIDAQCIGIAGKAGLKQFEALIEREGLKAVLMPVEGSIRTNLKVVSEADGRVTEFNEPGARVNESDFEVFCEMLKTHAQGSGYLVLTGSLPPGLKQDTYAALMRKNSHMPCVLDAAGDSLMSAVSAQPFMVKPNISELSKALNRELKTIRDICSAATVLVDRGAKNVIVSMGEAGAIMTNGKKNLYAQGLKVQAKSTVGAGDAMVGGMLCGLEREGDIAQAFKYAVAAGSASVLTEGTQLIRLDDFKELLPKVKIQEV